MLIVIVLYALLDGIVGIAWLVLPVFAAILISQKGAQQYLDESSKGPVIWIKLLLGFWTYAALLSDKLPLENVDDSVEFNVEPNGNPTVGQALLRIILAIPHGIVLWVLGVIGAFVWVGTVIALFANGTYPDWAYNYFRGYLRWYARVFAYLASLVDEYPPFSFEDGQAAPQAGPPASAPAVEPPATPPAGTESRSESDD